MWSTASPLRPAFPRPRDGGHPTPRGRVAAMPNRAPPPSPAPAATRSPSPFTAPERDLIRRELHPRFGQDPSIADGIMLRTWRSGPNAGQPKLPPAVQSLIERGLVVVRTDGRWPAAHFTEAGLAALHRLAQDRRALDPGRYAHVRRELGLDAGDGNTAGEVDSSGTRAGGA
jgi:hypothetical protein